MPVRRRASFTRLNTRTTTKAGDSGFSWMNTNSANRFMYQRIMKSNVARERGEGNWPSVVRCHTWMANATVA